MSFLFNYCEQLKDIDALQNWNVSHVEKMSAMFQHTYSLTSIDLSHWDVSNVTNMTAMFGAGIKDKISSLSEIKGLDKWNTSKVITMQWIFAHQVSLKELDLSSWDTSNVTNMNGMFTDTNLEKIYVSNKFVTDQVTDSTNMFSRNTNQAGVLPEASLVGGNGTRWDANHIDKEYARIDTNETPGYFTLKTN